MGKGTWHLLPTTPAMLPTATEHFDRAADQKPDALIITPPCLDYRGGLNQGRVLHQGNTADLRLSHAFH